MGRAPCCDKANVKKGPWSPEEDAKLKDFIHKFGTAGNWIALPQKAGLRRCGKSCRLRWLNYLRPNIKHGEFSDEEDRIICTLYASIGSRWSIIASQLPGRTDNDIKNYWNTKLKKKLLGKSTSPFYSLQSPAASLTGLSQLYTSLYTQATKSLITSINNISSSPPNNFLVNNHHPLLINGVDQFSFHHQQQPNQVDFQYDHDMNFRVVKDNMLMFGGNPDRASCSSDNSCGRKDVSQEEMLMGSGFISDDHVIQKPFYLDHYYGTEKNNNIHLVNGGYSIDLDRDQRKTNENGSDHHLLGYDLEEVIISDNDFLFRDD